MKGTRLAEGQGSGVRGQGRAAIAVALFVVAVVVLLAGAGTRTASAIEGALRIESKTALVGETVSVDMFADVGPPGLGAWTVDPVWDPSVLAAISCQPYAGGVCSMNFASDEGRVTGASMTGIVGETRLATLVFRCNEAGISELRLKVEVFADATPDAPQDIDETVQNGAITCVASSGPGVIQISTAMAPLGELAETAIVAVDIPPPGLGAWTIDVQYDPDVITPDDCTPSDNGACNPTFARDKVRVTGASATGIIGGFTLATITFRCGDQPGLSALHLSEEIGTTAGVANPQLQDLQDGFVRCFGPDTPGPTATPAAALPSTGSGLSDSASPLWLIVALAALSGAALVLSAFVLRRRA